MTAIADTTEYLNIVNRCQIAELERAGRELDPEKDCALFSTRVVNVQAAVIHTYQLVAFAAVRQADPKKAALMWKEMSDYCDSALVVLKDLKVKYYYCGTSQLYDLILDYKGEAQKRYYQNLQDSECQTPTPGLLFPETV